MSTTTDKLADALSCLIESATNPGEGTQTALDVASARAALAEYEAQQQARPIDPLKFRPLDTSRAERFPNGEHTSEPWRVIEQKRRPDGWRQTFIAGADYPGAGIVADVNMARSPLPAIDHLPPDGAANARRIVACVNACAGIDTTALEGASVAALRDAARGLYPFVPYNGNHDQAENEA